METMGTLRRTHYCGELTAAEIGSEIVVAGSIAKSRDLGGVVFADLRDTTGILQLSFDDSTDRAIFAKASGLKTEYVVIAKGELRRRENVNKTLPTGELELFVRELRVLSEAETTPFELRDGIKVKDELRLKYRYLDLRRESMHNPIVLRSRIAKLIRDYYCAHHFCEIETPMLIKSTPEGARDYLVPSRVQPGHFYALPQSPQLYKQLLMLSGFDRYFQIARCFRDEDLRADRQPEFTQIDMEMSFVSEEDIETMNEGLIKTLFQDVLDIEVETPFLRMPYPEAMSRFGSDKPDTRFGMELRDVTETVKDCEFVVFKNAIAAGGSVRCINAKGLADKMSRKEIDKLTEVVKTYGAKGLAYTRITAEGTSSSFEKFLSEDETLALRAAAGIEVGDVLLVVADGNNEHVFAALGALRLEIAKKYDLIDQNKFNFLWVTDF
ncbi:MAG: aspartate--tRNA ligase, partial [Pygmaiobacter sp.]